MYIEKRLNPVPDREPNELNAVLEKVVQSFGAPWLVGDGDNPVQELWRRPDHIATTELLILGHALQRLSPFPGWLRAQVDRVKGNDANNRRGALFEILALGQLNGNNFVVEPTPTDHPGHDAFVRFTCGAAMGLSLKSYEVSIHERKFEQEAQEAWNRFIQHLKGNGKNAVDLYVFLEAHYPKPGDWKNLRAAIAQGCASFNGTTFPLSAPPWVLFFVPLVPQPGMRLAADAISAKLLICARRHVNDEKNLISKLDEARANLEKHAKGDPTIANAVLVRVPSDASTAACREWAKAYLANNPSSPVSLVLLYQVDVVRDEDGEKSFLCHFFAQEAAPLHSTWMKQWPGTDLALRIVTPIGKAASEPSQRWLMLPNQEKISVVEQYTFQRGLMHVEEQMSENGSRQGFCGEVAEGVLVGSVMSVPGGRIAIQPKVPTSHRLLIL